MNWLLYFTRLLALLCLGMVEKDQVKLNQIEFIVVDSCLTDPKKGFHFFCGCKVIGVHCWNMCRKNKPLVPILSCFDKFWMERNSVHFYFISDHFGFWKNLMIHLAILDQLLFAGKMNFFFIFRDEANVFHIVSHSVT